MPRLEDIDKFVTTLNSLGKEQEILSERGESIAAVKPPEPGLTDDLKDLFGPPSSGEDIDSLLAGGGEESPASEETPENLEAPLDFNSLFNEPPEAGVPAEEKTDLGDFDLETALGGAGAPEPEKPEDTFDTELPAGEPESFASEDDLLKGFDLEEEKPAEAAVETPGGPEDFSLDDSAFNIPDLSETEEGETSETPETEELKDDLDFSLEDFGIKEGEEPGTEEPAMAAESADESTLR